MKILMHEQLQKSLQYIERNGRDIDKSLAKFIFNKGTPQDVLETLTKYQNSDGGFGHGLEPDFRTPLSSNMATTYAFQYFHKLNQKELPEFMNNALIYFANNYNYEHKIWFALPKESDASPHAIWWNYDLDRMLEDSQWGNPTVEIIGYLLKYPNDFDKEELSIIKAKALNRLFTGNEIEVHELMCYQQFARCLPPEESKQVYEKISQLAVKQVERDTTKWQSYVSRPFNFVDGPDSPVLDVLRAEVDTELDYFIDTIGEDGSWQPNWHWMQYDDVWEKVKPEVAGMVTLRNLIQLNNFGRIEL